MLYLQGCIGVSCKKEQWIFLVCYLWVYCYKKIVIFKDDMRIVDY